MLSLFWPSRCSFFFFFFALSLWFVFLLAHLGLCVWCHSCCGVGVSSRGPLVSPSCLCLWPPGVAESAWVRMRMRCVCVCVCVWRQAVFVLSVGRLPPVNNHHTLKGNSCDAPNLSFSSSSRRQSVTQQKSSAPLTPFRAFVEVWAKMTHVLRLVYLKVEDLVLAPMGSVLFLSKAQEGNRLWDLVSLENESCAKKSQNKPKAFISFVCKMSESDKNVNQSPKLMPSNVLFCLTYSPKQHTVTLEKLQAEDVSSSCRLISRRLNKRDRFYDRALETRNSSSQEPTQAWDAL